MADQRGVAPRDDIQKHYAWRKMVAENMPDIAQRVFGLREKFYYGCGFHYGLERSLGSIIATVNDYDNPIEKSTQITDKVRYEDFVERLERAEWSAANNAADPEAEGSPWFAPPAARHP